MIVTVHSALNTRIDEIANLFFPWGGVGVESSLTCSLLYLYYAKFLILKLISYITIEANYLCLQSS